MIYKHFNKNQWFDKMLCRIAGFKIPYIILSAIILDIVITSVFSFILFPDHTAGPKFEPTIFDFLVVAIVGPLIETAIVQLWIIKAVLKYSSNNKLFALIISSVIFGLAHYYSVPYFMKATLAGAIYGLVWLSIACKQKDPFFYVALTHGLYNSIGFIGHTLL